MKKFIAIAIAVLTVFSFTTVAFAESTTTLTTTVPDAEYTLNIPADQEIPYGAESTNIGSISVTNASGFAEEKNLKVTLTFDDFKCEEASTTIPFYIQMQGTNVVLGDKNSGDFLTFVGQADGTTSEYAIEYKDSTQFYSASKTYLKINSTDWGKALAGEYTATITFTAEVVAA